MSIYFNLLTSKQKKVYSAIESYIRLNGIPPTVREIGEMVGEKTPGAVQGILDRLEQKGVIKRQAGMARSIKLVSPEDAIYADPVYIPEIKKISKRNINNLLSVYNISKYHPVSPDLIKSGENCFIISCPDDSLYETAAKDRDMLLINMCLELKDSDIVLVLYENHVYLRRYFVCEQQGMVILKADSNLIDKEIFSENEVKIIGKLAVKFTRYL